jgi:hypothetical protein
MILKSGNLIRFNVDDSISSLTVLLPLQTLLLHISRCWDL